MDAELEHKLIIKYPKLFKGMTRPLTENLMGFGMECGDGWFNILDKLFEKLNNHDIELMQVKEKFGGLRIYINGGTDEVYDLIDKAEQESFTICEKCGKPGKNQEINYWLYTVCEEHKKELLSTSG
jgi:hypothetical protein